jgi:NADPH:quinone reductase-like Zn-dependent oxidoreductase
MKAIVLQGEPGKASLVTDRPYPKPRPGYVLVDVKALALNPTDGSTLIFSTLKIAYLAVISPEWSRRPAQAIPSRGRSGIAFVALLAGGNMLCTEDGAFAERIAVKADIQMRIPDNMSFEDAATLGVGVITCGQGLFQQMQLNMPPNATGSINGESVLICGGSTATGSSLGIQLLKM